MGDRYPKVKGAADADLLRALLARLAEARGEEIGRALRNLLQRTPHPES